MAWAAEWFTPRSRRRASIDQAKLVPFWIRHRSPAEAVLHEICLRSPPSSADRLDARCGGVDVVHADVQVNAVLHELRLADPLERHIWRIGKLALQVYELRWGSEPSLDLNAQELRPKGCETLRIRAVDLYPTDASDWLAARASPHGPGEYSPPPRTGQGRKRAS